MFSPFSPKIIKDNKENEKKSLEERMSSLEASNLSLEAKMDRVLQVLERLAPGQVPLPLPVPLLQANLQDEGKEESVGDFTSKEGTPAKEHTNTPKSAAKKEGDSCESTEKVDPKKPPIPQQGTPKQFENPRAPEPLLGVTPGDDSTQAFSNRK